MTKVYMIRHAEAEGNLFRRAHGWFNGQLTELGKKQLSFLAERFADVRLDAVYSSDLRRARETAEAVAAARGLSVRVDPELREVNLGVWEDLPWGELQHSYREQYINFNKHPEAFRLEGAEPFAESKRRMLAAVERIAACHEGQTVALVSHGAALHALLEAVREQGSGSFGQGFSDNTAVSLLEAEGGRVRCVYANDSSHLPEGFTNFYRQNWWQSLESTDSGDMRFVSPALEGDWRALYARWTAGSAGAPAADEAAERVRRFPGSVCFAMKDDRPAGLLITDADRDSPEAGRLVWVCLDAGSREQHLSAQLVGQAISVLRKSGIFTARAALSGAEAPFAPYFEQFGFRACGGDYGCAQLAKDISL